MLTAPEKKLVYLLRFWILAFGINTLIFIFWHTPLVELINEISLRLTPALLPTPLPQEKFYFVLSLSLMFTLIYMCLIGQANIRINQWVIPAILVSKFTSTFFFFVFFLFYQKSLTYMVGTLTDGFVFLVTYFVYQKAKPYLSIQEP